MSCSSAEGRTPSPRPRQSTTGYLLLGDYYLPRDPLRAADFLEAYFVHRPEGRPQDAAIKLKLASAYLRASANGKARDTFDEALAVSTSSRQRMLAKLGLCAAYTGLRQYQSAVALCADVAKEQDVDPTASAWSNLAVSYLAMQMTAQARDAALEFARRKPQSPKGFILVGDTFFEEGRYREAVDYYERADERSAGSPSQHLRERLTRAREALSRE